MTGRQILLIEPGYKNKYPPLGLMKIAQYHGDAGKRDHVRFIKGEDKSALAQAWDRIYVTTLFSFEYPKIAQTIDFALRAANGHPDKVFVGGIAASLMHDRFLSEDRWHGIRFIKGLLNEAPAVSLQLDDFSDELYSDDVDGRPIEDLIPDYSILDHVSYRYPVNDAYFAYTSRGCIRKCHFCGVPKLEGGQRDTESLTAVVRAIEQRYGPKKDLILMDNNVVASPRFKDIIAEIRDLGFNAGAMLKRPDMRVAAQRRVDFNQGVDARILCKDPMYLRELATTCLRPLRIAFDHLGLKTPYDKAVRIAADVGLRELSNYMLYNFKDGPEDLFERMWLNVELNENLGMRIWSFPMRYQPTDRPDRGHVGERWTRFELRSMQTILQATHGVVSGEPVFFRRAFGGSYAEYERILAMPNDFVFNRDWYEHGAGQGRHRDWTSAYAKLTATDRAELMSLLSSCDPRRFVGLPDKTTTTTVRDILPFYVPMDKDKLFAIWAAKRAGKANDGVPQGGLAEDEFVEDAGLDDDDTVAA